MGRAITSLLAQLIISTTIFAMNMLLVSIAGLLRLLPSLLPLLGRGLWASLVLSCRLYRLLLGRFAPFVEVYAGIKIAEGLWRLVITLSFSLALGLIFLLWTGWALSLWTIAPFALHGLFVDFIWDEIPETDGLQIGNKL